MSHYTSLKGVPFFKPDPAEELLYQKAMYSPPVNIEETDEHYLLSVAVPGLKREHFEIGINNQLITISAAQKTSPKSQARCTGSPRAQEDHAQPVLAPRPC